MMRAVQGRRTYVSLGAGALFYERCYNPVQSRSHKCGSGPLLVHSCTRGLAAGCSCGTALCPVEVLKVSAGAADGLMS